MIGIKLYSIPEDVNGFLSNIKELNIDSLFLGEDALKSPDFFKLLKCNGLSCYYIFQTFYNPDYLKKNPDSYAITSSGEIARDEWVEFVCPTDRNYIDFIKDQLTTVIKKYNPTGISLDFIRQFIFWEKVIDSKSHRLVKSCCCSRCTQDSRSSEEIITDVVKELSNHIRSIKDGIIVDLHAVPWKLNEYDIDGYSICGQNLKEIGRFVDFITPMCYSHMLKKDPEWIKDIVVNHTNSSQVPIIPAIQAKECYLKEALTPEIFEDVLNNSLKEPSKGVIIWSWDDIKSDRKRETFRKIVTNYISG